MILLWDQMTCFCNLLSLINPISWISPYALEYRTHFSGEETRIRGVGDSVLLCAVVCLFVFVSGIGGVTDSRMEFLCC